jgi:hypothetical protein
MPIFTSTSHVQITGGNFIEVSGDFNVEATQPLGTGNVDEIVKGLDFDLTQHSGRHLMGAERTQREGGTRMLPYGAFGSILRHTDLKYFADVPHRRHLTPQPIQLYSDSSATHSSTSFSSGYLHSPVHRFSSYEGGGASNDPGSGGDIDDLDPTAMNDWGANYGLGLQPMHNHHPFPEYSQYPFSSPPDSQLNDLVDCPGEAFRSYTSREPPHAARDRNCADLGTSQPCRFHTESNSPSRPVLNRTLEFPWNRPANAPATNIHGGTFISGNVSNIERHGEAGESQ